ncbi:MAG: VCBS repeat-containing protein, partial [Acidobacteriota bacterium]
MPSQRHCLCAFAPLFVLAPLLGGCGAAETPRPLFVDLDPAPAFSHDHGGTGALYFPEVMAGGGALLDVDGDGDLDLYAAQGGPLGGDAPGGPDRLFRNDLATSGGFVDITDVSGLAAEGYGMGAAAGDFDNDGDVDIYTLNFGANQLWRNRGDGTFEDVTDAAGVADPAWSVSASWVDLDGDGWLDLYVANYVDFSVERHVACRSPLGTPDYCSPLAYRPAPDTLYRNRGDGTFEDISASSGIRRRPQNGLGVVALDADVKQGLADIYSPEWADYSAGFRKRMDSMDEEAHVRFEKIIRAGDHLADHLHEAP